MPPTVVREANATITYGGPPGTVVDLACDAWALDLTSDTESIDIGTFCDPGATDVGRTTYSAVLSVLWSPDLVTKLTPHIGEVGTFLFTPDPTAPTVGITFDTRVSAIPFGRFEVGARVEADMALAVLTTPAMTP